MNKKTEIAKKRAYVIPKKVFWIKNKSLWACIIYKCWNKKLGGPPPPGFVQTQQPYPTQQSAPYPAQQSTPYPTQQSYPYPTQQSYPNVNQQPYPQYNSPTVLNVAPAHTHQVLVVGACPSCRVRFTNGHYYVLWSINILAVFCANRLEFSTTELPAPVFAVAFYSSLLVTISVTAQNYTIKANFSVQSNV